MSVSSGFQFVADHGDDIDEVAIHRRLEGDRAVELSQREREVAVWELHHKGWSDRQISRSIGFPVQTVYRIRKRLGLLPHKEPLPDGVGNDSGGGPVAGGV